MPRAMSTPVAGRTPHVGVSFWYLTVTLSLSKYFKIVFPIDTYL